MFWILFGEAVYLAELFKILIAYESEINHSLKQVSEKLKPITGS